MAKSDVKTKKTEKSVPAFIKALKNPQMREDSATLVTMMKRVAKAPAKLWGTAIVGFGEYHYVYDSGREGDWPLIGFAPRANGLSLYLMCAMAKKPPLLKKLGKHKFGVGCLYIKQLADVDLKVLEQLMKLNIAETKQWIVKQAKKHALKKKKKA